MTDIFDTKPGIVKICLTRLKYVYPNQNWDLIIEPSAGSGNFFNQLPPDKRIGMDISPRTNTNDIIKCDFFDYNPTDLQDKKILVIGNPPFGKVCSLAVNFFNHAAQFATVIAFIVPRSFRKFYIQKRLNHFFHIISDLELPTNPCCFEPPVSARCCFQIWEKKNIERIVELIVMQHRDFSFLNFVDEQYCKENADFAFRCYGSRIGDIKMSNEFSELTVKNYYWFKSNIPVEILINKLRQLDYSCSSNTSNQHSIGKAELVKMYDTLIKYYLINVKFIK